MEEKRIRKKRKLGSYPFLSVIFSSTVALCVLGLFGWIILHSTKLSAQIQESIEIQVYLNKNLSKSDLNKIESTISSKSYILSKNNKPQVAFISKEKAAEEFISDTGEDFKDFLGDNPLRDLYALRIYSDYQSLDSLTKIKNEIEAIRGVFEVEYEESLIESINQNVAKIGILLISIALFAILIVVMLINNTIKLALFSQRFLIRSMQLVGATSSFIKRPFLIRSAIYGLLAGIISCVLMHGFTLYMNKVIKGLADLQILNDFIIFYLIIIAIGMLVGYLSALRAINKYLKMSLDELY